MKKVPFYANPDDTSCLQATLRMVMEYFEPSRGWTWPLVNAYTDKVEGKGTLTLRMCINLVKDGYDVVYHDDMDVEALGEDPIAYFKGKYTGDVLAYMLKNVDVDIAQASAKDFVAVEQEASNLHYLQTSYTLQDMERYLEEGYLLMPCHNSSYLDYEKKYCCHILVIFDMDDDFFYAHDSGWFDGTRNFGRKGVKIPKEHMFKACLIEDKTDSFYAIRKKGILHE